MRLPEKQEETKEAKTYRQCYINSLLQESSKVTKSLVLQERTIQQTGVKVLDSVVGFTVGVGGVWQRSNTSVKVK